MNIYYVLKRMLYVIIIISLNGILKITPFSHLRIILLKLFGANIGKNSFMSAGVKFDFPWRLSIGNNCYISKGVYFDCRGGKIIIENSVDISEFSVLYTLSHDINSTDFQVKKGDIRIEDRVWICTRSIVLPGTEIKKACVIGANSVISGITDYNTLYVGVPANFVRKLPENRSIYIRNYNE